MITAQVHDMTGIGNNSVEDPFRDAYFHHNMHHKDALSCTVFIVVLLSCLEVSGQDCPCWLFSDHVRRDYDVS